MFWTKNDFYFSMTETIIFGHGIQNVTTLEYIAQDHLKGTIESGI